MKNTLIALLSVALIAVVFVMGRETLADNALAQPPGNDVVILRCTVSDQVSSMPTVMSMSGSVTAPAVTRGTDCAQAVADLLNLGFGIQDFETGVWDGETDLYYTLVLSGGS